MKINLQTQTKRDLVKILKSNLMESFLELVVSIIENKQTPLLGIGKPEQLKGYSTPVYSRQISKKDRIVYEYDQDDLVIYSYVGHYDDK